MSEERELNFIKCCLASHIEAKIIEKVLIEHGKTLTITGTNAPCPFCKGKMNKAVIEKGSVVYQWREKGETKIWKTIDKKW